MRNLMHHMTVVTASVLPFLLTGCSSPIVTSSKNTDTGLAYSLPRSRLLVIAERKAVTPTAVTKAKEEAATAKTIHDADRKAVAEATKQLETLQGQLKVAEDSVQADLLKSAKIQEALVGYLTVKLKSSSMALKAAGENAEKLAAADGDLLETVTIKSLPMEPDPNYRYVVNVNHKPWRTDSVKFNVSNGLLSASNVTSSDQSLTIALNIIKAGLAISGALSPGPHSNITRKSVKNIEKSCEYSTSYIFDPFQEIPHKTAQIHDASSVMLTVDKGDFKSSTNADGPDHKDGVFYRTLAPITITVMPKAPNNDYKHCIVQEQPSPQVLSFLLPDTRKTYWIEAKAGAFTTGMFNLTLKDGMPAEYTFNQPSELAALSSFPIDVAKAIISVPAEILQLKVNYNNQAAALTKAEIDILKAELDRLKAEQSLTTYAQQPP